MCSNCLLARCCPAPHRYLVSTDGWGVSAKLEKSLLLGCTVLKAGSPMFAHFYSAMLPWVHYVPFYQHHEEDILQAVAALKADDALARRIAANGAKFAASTCPSRRGCATTGRC